MQYQSRGALLPKKWNEIAALRDYFDGAVFLLAMLIVAFRWEVVGCLVFLGIIGAALVSEIQWKDPGRRLGQRNRREAVRDREP